MYKWRFLLLQKRILCAYFFVIFCAHTMDTVLFVCHFSSFLVHRFVLFIVFINGELIFVRRLREWQEWRAKGAPFSTSEENFDQKPTWKLQNARSTKSVPREITKMTIWKLKALKSSFIWKNKFFDIFAIFHLVSFLCSKPSMPNHFCVTIISSVQCWKTCSICCGIQTLMLINKMLLAKSYCYTIQFESPT